MRGSLTDEVGRKSDPGSSRGLDPTLDQLDEIIADAHANQSPMGIFPAMYRSVTAEIRGAVHGGFFSNNTTMEHLAVVFADRYLDAYALWMAGDKPTRSWQVAFSTAEDGRRHMIVQHLLAGMNAHINLDLGIVAADVSGDDPDHVYGDFLRVNEILIQKLNGLQDTLGSVSTRMAWVDRIGWRFDERLMSRAIKDARDDAWTLARSLMEHPADRERIIEQRDVETAELGETIVGGTMPVRAVSRFMARSEPKDVRVVIDAFADGSIDLDQVEIIVNARIDTQGRAS